MWGASTAAFAACSSLHAGVAVWAFNGVGLALVVPNTQARRDLQQRRGGGAVHATPPSPPIHPRAPSAPTVLLALPQSLTADLFPEGARGRAFGLLYLTGALGGMLGALWATNMGRRAGVCACA